MKNRVASASSLICCLLVVFGLLCFSELYGAQTTAGGFSLPQILSSPFPRNLVAAERAGRARQRGQQRE